MATVTLTAEVSERNSKGDSKKVIRINLEGQHVYTRTLIMSSFGSTIDRMRDGFKAADDKGLTLEPSMKAEIRRFAETFGQPGSFFWNSANRTRRVYVSINRRPGYQPRRRPEHHSDSGDAAVAGMILGGLAGLVIGISLGD